MDEEVLTPATDGGAFFKKNFTTVTILSKYVALILFIALPFIGGWVGYKYSPEKLIIVDKIISEEPPTSDIIIATSTAENIDTKIIIATSTSKLNPLMILQALDKKYGFGPRFRYVGSTDNFFWFEEPHTTEGCNYLSYINLNSGEETESNLSACPLVDISESFPFHVALCQSESDNALESLCVTNLFNLEKKKITVVKNAGETMISECHDATMGIECKYDVQSWNDGLSVRIYKPISREPFTEYKNSSFDTREESIDLFKEFNLE